MYGHNPIRKNACVVSSAVKMVGGILVIPRNEVNQIPYLRALTSSLWHKGNPRYYTLIPAQEWNNDLTILADLLRFLRESHEGHYRLPHDFRRTFLKSRENCTVDSPCMCAETPLLSIQKHKKVMLTLYQNA